MRMECMGRSDREEGAWLTILCSGVVKVKIG